MTHRKQRALPLLLALCLTLSLTVQASAAKADAALPDTARTVLTTVQSPQVGSIGGEWAVLGLARSGYAVPESWYQSYYAAVEAHVKACRGVLH